MRRYQRLRWQLVTSCGSQQWWDFVFCIFCCHRQRTRCSKVASVNSYTQRRSTSFPHPSLLGQTRSPHSGAALKSVAFRFRFIKQRQSPFRGKSGLVVSGPLIVSCLCLFQGNLSFPFLTREVDTTILYIFFRPPPLP